MTPIYALKSAGAHTLRETFLRCDRTSTTVTVTCAGATVDLLTNSQTCAIFDRRIFLAASIRLQDK